MGGREKGGGGGILIYGNDSKATSCSEVEIYGNAHEIDQKGC